MYASLQDLLFLTHALLLPSSCQMKLAVGILGMVQHATLEYQKLALPKMPSLGPKDRVNWNVAWMGNPLHRAYKRAIMGTKDYGAATFLRLKGNPKLAKKVLKFLKCGKSRWKARACMRASELVVMCA